MVATLLLHLRRHKMLRNLYGTTAATSQWKGGFCSRPTDMASPKWLVRCGGQQIPTQTKPRFSCFFSESFEPKTPTKHQMYIASLKNSRHVCLRCPPQNFAPEPENRPGPKRKGSSSPSIHFPVLLPLV